MRSFHLSSVCALFVGALSSVTGCAMDAGSERGADTGEEDAIIAAGTQYQFRCNDGTSSLTVSLKAHDELFDLKAVSASGTVLFEEIDQRPWLGVQVEDGTSDDVHEYVGFSDKGLEVVPVDGPKALELDLGGAKELRRTDGQATTKLDCRHSVSKLQQFVGLNLVASSRVDIDGVKAVGFDIDDTLAFTTPTFARGFATGGTPAPTDTLFWTHTNGCDPGCPSESITLADGSIKLLPETPASTPKEKAIELVRRHKARGNKVYAITARPDINGDPLRDFIESELGIAREDVFFEPDIDQPGNVKGKTDRIESLNLDLFYGDSDSDITDSTKAFVDASGQRTKQVRAVRFLRSPKSSNRKAGKLNKYHPGYFGEVIVKDSY
jgi:acid phosphatase (class B)